MTKPSTPATSGPAISTPDPATAAALPAVPAQEPVISLGVFLESTQVSRSQAVVLGALYPSRKLTRSGWLELATSEMQREVR